MKLYDYLKLMPDGDELTVCDKDYDMETYFYGGEDKENRWQCALINLSKLLTVTEITSSGVTINLSDVIEKNIPKLKNADLFISCDIDSIMEDIDNILSGCVSEEWMERFVSVLKGE